MRVYQIVLWNQKTLLFWRLHLVIFRLHFWLFAPSRDLGIKSGSVYARKMPYLLHYCFGSTRRLFEQVLTYHRKVVTHHHCDFALICLITHLFLAQKFARLSICIINPVSFFFHFRFSPFFVQVCAVLFQLSFTSIIFTKNMDVD